MIDRYAIAVSAKDILERYNLDPSQQFTETFNAFPTKVLPIITNREPGTLSFFHWGQTPEWANNKKLSSKYFNASIEAIRTKASLKKNFDEFRCIIPSSGFYTWKKVGKKSNVPYYNHLSDQKIFSIAGIWEQYSDLNNNRYQIFKIITQGYTSGDGENHVYPAILDIELESEWLKDESPASSLLDSINDNFKSRLVSYSISPMIAKTNIDNEMLIKHEPPSDQHGNYTLFD